ncbi:phenylacetate--CoA ligase family protein [Gottfriedia endophytica]|nr:phenylacetate--CoA ligase family protein [Gottfriedia endophytica]
MPNRMKVPLLYAASLLPKNLIENKEYKDYVKFLAESELWDSTQISEFQNMQLKLLIKHAYENVPYYTEVFNEYGIRVEDIQDTGDLKKLPLINKEIIKNNKDKFIAKNFNFTQLNKISTGGTTSGPMEFFDTHTTVNREMAFFHRIWNNYGYNDQLCLVLRGDAESSEKLYKYNPYKKLISINTRNINDHKMKGIIEIINKYKPPYLQAYPSLIYLLSKYINEHDLSRKIPNFKAIFCSSEKMYDFQRDEIKRAFSTVVIDYYGHSERTALMEYCPICKMYHVIPEYGVIEFLDKSGNSNDVENHLTEIVGTSFNNYAFPLIRYQTFDIATMSGSNYKNKCNKPYVSIKEIDGRSGDFLITKDGKLYSPTILDFAIYYIPNFKEMQLVQHDYEQLEVLIVPSKSYKKDEGNRFVAELQKRIDTKMNIYITLVNQIERPSNQKHRFVVSKIKK